MGDNVEVTVVRTSDASKSTIKLPLSAPLNTLKDQISRSSLGPVSREHQRIFHLGRELKSGKRSLNSLGFAKHGIFVIHLHSTQPKTIELKDGGDDDDEVEVAGVKPNNVLTNGDFDEIEILGSRLGPPPSQQRPPYRYQQQQQQPVIDLLESDDGEDDEDEDVQVVDSNGRFDDYSYKRQRFRWFNFCHVIC